MKRRPRQDHLKEFVVEEFVRATGLLVGFLAYGIVVVPFLMLGLAVPYAVLRMRDARSESPEPQLGLRAALYYFMSLAILVALSGLTVIVVDYVVERKAPQVERQFPRPGEVPRAPEAKLWPDDFPTPAQRVGGAMVGAGVLFAVLHLGLILVVTEDRKWPAARRLFTGWRFGIHGLVVLTTVTILLAVVFQKDFGDWEVRKALLAILLVWLPSWVVHLSMLRYYSRPLYRPNRVVVAAADD
jgi:hypothetical protein